MFWGGCNQRKGLTSGEVSELPGKFGRLPGNLWIAVKFHSDRTSGEVAENFRGSSGNFRGNFPEARGSLTPHQRLAKFVSIGSRTEKTPKENLHKEFRRDPGRGVKEGALAPKFFM